MKQNVIAKTAVFLLALALLAVGGALGVFQGLNAEVLWDGGDTGESRMVGALEYRDYQDVMNLYHYEQSIADSAVTGAYANQRLTALREVLSRENTNLRWAVVNGEGQVVYTNAEAGALEGGASLPGYREYQFRGSGVDTVYATSWANWAETAQSETQAVVSDAAWKESLSRWYGDMDGQSLEKTEGGYTADGVTYTGEELERVYTDENGYADILIVETPQRTYCFGPSKLSVLESNQFGFQYVVNEGWVQTGAVSDQSNLLTTALWVDTTFPVADSYRDAWSVVTRWQGHGAVLLLLTAVCGVLWLGATVALCVTCGHKKGVDGLSLNWFHRIPGDLLLCLMILAGVGLFGGAYGIASAYGELEGFTWRVVLALCGLIAAGGGALVTGFLVTLTARCKSRTLLRNTVIALVVRWLWSLCRRFGRRCARGVEGVSLVWKMALGGAIYLILSLILASVSVGWLALTVAVLVGACMWAHQWKRIRMGTREIVGGNTEYHIDTEHMFADLKGHAEQLNNLSQSVARAVDERVKSEQFKAELITNVSHDLKTPLTSIISYVDLLKKENIDNPRAAEYIEVLERKSQRLKKLTEDLVEASKASTGALTVTPERLDLGQLADQALAEYEERLEQHGLVIVRTLPEQPLWVLADGRHLWRVIDNLLSNCAKYALEGTRVYVEVQGFSDCAKLSVKNISREILNMSAGRLMERFVRGDESRTAEGSGLGLSIAQSLAELQGGAFAVSVDGDLFKATVTLPLAPETENL